MIEQFDLEQVIADQRERFERRKTGIPRNIPFERYTGHNRIVIISGVRRCGKSTLLSQFKDYG